MRTDWQRLYHELLAQHTALMEEWRLMRRELTAAQLALAERPQWGEPTVMHASEEVEDAEWAHDNNLVSKREYQAILQAAGLEPNIDIE